MSVTKQDIKALTPQHRVVWHSPPGQPVEMGLYLDEHGHLCTDMGNLIRFENGGTLRDFSRIVKIIEPPLTPRVGVVIGRPGFGGRRLIHTGGDTVAPWLGYAPELNDAQHWFTTKDARYLIETFGWEVMGDLSAPGEVTDAEVEAAATALADGAFGSGRDRWSGWVHEARAALEAAREARNV